MIAVEEQSNADSARSCGSGGGGGGSCPPWLDEGLKLRRPRPDQTSAEEEQEVDFLWKQGPSPPPLRGRPSLGLIRTGHVRILSKQLVMLCPDGVKRGVARGEHAGGCEEVRFRWMRRRGMGQGAGVVGMHSRGGVFMAYGLCWGMIVG